MKLKDFVEPFLRVAETRNRAYEVAAKERILRLHLVPAFGELELGDLSAARVQDYVATKLQAGRLRKKTVNNQLACLRRLLVVAKTRGLLVEVPAIEWLKPEPAEFTFLTFEEARELVRAADAGMWKRMILVALHTGLRRSELLGLKPEDVVLEKRVLEVRRACVAGVVGPPKSNRFRSVPLSRDACRALEFQIAEAKDTVFPTTSSLMRAPLERARRFAEIARPLSWHDLRHTFASHLAMRGVPLRAVQELLGHRTMTMTLRYAHLSPESLRDAVSVLDGDHEDASGARSPAGRAGATRSRFAREPAPRPLSSGESTSRSRDRRPYLSDDGG